MNVGNGSPENHSDDRYVPHRSSLRLRESVPIESLVGFGPYLRSIAMHQWRRSLAAKESVSDIVQESLTVGVRDFNAFQGKTEGELAAWLRRILLRVMHSKLRKYGAQKADVGREEAAGGAEFESPVDTPSEIFIQIEQRIRIEHALEQIAPHHRQVIELHHIDGLSFVEIGRQLDKSPDAIRKLWVRGLLSLQERVGALPKSGHH